MGQLVEQKLSTLFQGISRQPNTIRLPGQVEDGENAVFSVVTGGFEKRPGSKRLGKNTGISDADMSGSFDFATHFYERDTSERYAIFIDDEGTLAVSDLIDGSQATVSGSAGSPYLTTMDDGKLVSERFSFVTIADFTLIVNKQKLVAMGAIVPGGVIDGTVQKFADLPTPGVADTVFRVTGRDSDNFTGFLVKFDGDVWNETVDPTIANSFDATTMPHKLVRESNGTFTFSVITWSDRLVGDDVLSPNPDFVGKKLNDIVFHRDRLALMADEVVFFGQSGDFFNFWPTKMTDVLDSDPFGRATSGSEVNIISHVAPFDKSLFVTSDNQQFSLTSDGTLNPRQAVMDPTTNFKLSGSAAPVVVGDFLYFAAKLETDTAIFEYAVDDDSLTTTASDISKHIAGFIPSPVIMFTGESITGSVFCISSAEPSKLFAYKSFWQNNEKKQSAWASWGLGTNRTIKAMGILDGRLYVVMIEDDGGIDTVIIETISLTDELTDTTSVFNTTQTLNDGSTVSVPTRLDRRESVTGVFSASTGKTTFTVLGNIPVTADSVIMLGNGFSVPATELIIESRPDDQTYVVDGDHTAGAVIIGVNYLMNVTLSEQFLREGNALGTGLNVVTNGRLQLRRLAFDYLKSGFFQVIVTPHLRRAKVTAMNGRELADVQGQSGALALTSGTFWSRVKSNGRTVKLQVQNNTHMPCTITSGFWIGFFNEITRQE